MENPKIDLYFLVFASIFLFFTFTTSIIVFFAYYRKKQRINFQEKENLKILFQKELLQSQLEIQEQTFNHISQEIHDNVGQILSLAKIQISIMNETKNWDLIDDVRENISRALTDLRDVSKSLNSERIGIISILEAVNIEVERINKIGIIDANISLEGEERIIASQKKQILFRIIQESLQNIIKHAQATTVHLKFNYSPTELSVHMIDNGKGFDVNKALNNNAGLGLRNIKKRASIIGGVVDIESSLDNGSVLILKIPYE